VDEGLAAVVGVAVGFAVLFAGAVIVGQAHAGIGIAALVAGVGTWQSLKK
jgi:hypothetical protein